MKFKKAYERVRKPFSTSGPSLTHQSFKRECDINTIMAKYQKTGLVDHVANHQGDYSDLTDVPTYHDAMNKIISANQSFSTLPSSIRKKFSNDPAEFLDFVSNPENIEEMQKMGLIPESPIEPITSPSPPDVPPVADTPPSEPVA